MILEIFSLLHQKDPAWRLMLVGGGEDQPQVDAKIRALGIGPWVIQAGVRTNVPDDVSVTDLVHFLPLDAPLTQWAETACRIAPGGPHADRWPVLAAAGYELKIAASRMEQLYDRLAGEGNP